MRKSKLLLSAFLCPILFSHYGCGSNDTKVAAEYKENSRQPLEGEALVKRGESLLTIGGCNDCHTPKVFTEHEMQLDTAKMFAGHPANFPLDPVDADALQPGKWMQMSPMVTSFAGPWGISFAANLTPDSATGIGAWTEEVFIKCLRTGKHLGQENGRPILPPMPWYGVAKMTDEDLHAAYAYLRSLPPVSNRVPAPIPPNEVKLKNGKK